MSAYFERIIAAVPITDLQDRGLEYRTDQQDTFWIINPPRLALEQLSSQTRRVIRYRTARDRKNRFHQLPARACCAAATAGFTAALRAGCGTMIFAISSAVFSAAPTHWSIL